MAEHGRIQNDEIKKKKLMHGRKRYKRVTCATKKVKPVDVKGGM